MPGRASQAPPGPTCKADGGSVCSPATGRSYEEEEESERKRGSPLPTSGRKQPERRASRISVSLRPGATAAEETSSKKTAQKITEHPNVPDIRGGAPAQSFKELQSSAEKHLGSTQSPTPVQGINKQTQMDHKPRSKENLCFCHFLCRLPAKLFRELEFCLRVLEWISILHCPYCP